VAREGSLLLLLLLTRIDRGEVAEVEGGKVEARASISAASASPRWWEGSQLGDAWMPMRWLREQVGCTRTLGTCQVGEQEVRLGRRQI